ncbi:unnamed protein product [Ectocarpus sp. CCAP 1310/34]|nr:unnamed protein product [Ectocarpus sp. CCAP 1310/34]
MGDALRAAIRNGNTTTLIMELTKDEHDKKLVVQKLTKTYGGTINDTADGDGLFRNTSPLLHAARRGNDGVWVFLAGALENLPLLLLLQKCGILGAEMLRKDARGHTVPQLAALSGNQATFSRVRKEVQRLGNDEIHDMLGAKDTSGKTLLMAAFSSKGKETFRTALDLPMEQLTRQQVQQLTNERDHANQTLLSMAIDFQDAGLFEFVLNECRRADGLKKVLDVWDLVGSPPPSGSQVAETVPLDEIFSKCAERHLRKHAGRPYGLRLLSSLVASCARPSPSHLKKLAIAHAGGEKFRDCCLDAVASASNPFIPGLVLSIRLAEAAEKTNEGEQRAITDVHARVNDLLLEILEGLPRSVRSFERDMDASGDMFEPASLPSKDFETPMEMILSRRQQTEIFCSAPLVMDFIKRKFTLGLPSMRDKKEILADSKEIFHLSGGDVRGNVCLVLGTFVPITVVDADVRREDGPFIDLKAEDMDKKAARADHGQLSAQAWAHPTLLGSNCLLASFRSPRALLQGANDRLPCLTPFPAAQFIVAGLAARSNDYFRVPVMRMVLDLVVYLGVLVALSTFVLFRSQAEQSRVDGSADEEIVFRKLNWSEATCATAVIAGGMYREWFEMARNYGRYLEDQWNALDLLGLLFFTIGFIARVVDWTQQLGPAFYALSAPLLVSRALFFVQIHPLQGPMVIFRMTTVLLKFGFVMAVVMIGFTMAFHVLFRDFDSFGESFLELFKAMFGETTFFNAFSGDTYDAVATMLLVVYLSIVTILLLNLLVAILSTSHSKVQKNIDREFKASIARMMDHYQLVVTNDILPAPFNLLQLVVWPIAWCVGGCCGRSTSGSQSTRQELNRGREAYERGNKAIGPVVFWVVLGPVAVVGGTLLWIVSTPLSVYLWRKHHREGDRKRLSLISLGCRYFFIIPLWCILGAPVYLFVLWLGASRRLLCRCNYDVSIAHAESGHFRCTIESILLEGPGGVGAKKLREFLDDPMDDKDVRQDERDKRTTVEHVKLLRNRLENTIQDELRGLENALHKRMMKELSQAAN